MLRVRIAIAAVGAAGCLVLGATTAHAATIVVNTGDDAVANNDSHCTLREAINSAKNDAASGLLPGECSAGSGADVITLPAGNYFDGRIGNDDTNDQGDFDIASDVTIVGAGAAVTTIDGNTIDRVFDVQAGAVVTIQGVTITGGHAPTGGNGASHSSADGERGGKGGDGGGIRNAGTLTVRDSVIAVNVAGTGGNGGSGTGPAGSTGASPTEGGEGLCGGGGARGPGGGGYTDGPPPPPPGTVCRGNPPGG